MEATHYAVSAHADGFRRFGRQWSRELEIVAAEDFTAEQVGQLMDDPGFVVVELDSDAPSLDEADWILVSAHEDHFRRAGREWMREPVEVRAGELTLEQLDALAEDPMMVLVPIPAPGPSGAEQRPTETDPAADLEAARERVRELESQLAERDARIADLETELHNLRERGEAETEAKPPADGRSADSPKVGEDPSGTTSDGSILSVEDAIRALDRADAGHWTRDGKPAIPELAKRAGRRVTAAERDEAWTAIQAAG